MGLNRILFPPDTFSARLGQSSSRTTAQDSLANISNMGKLKQRRGKRQPDKFRINKDKEYTSVLMTLGDTKTTKAAQAKRTSNRSVIPTDSLLSLGINKENHIIPTKTKRTKRTKSKPIEKTRAKQDGQVSKRSREYMSKLTKGTGRDGLVRENSLARLDSLQISAVTTHEQRRKTSASPTQRKRTSMGGRVSKRARDYVDKLSRSTGKDELEQRKPNSKSIRRQGKISKIEQSQDESRVSPASTSIVGLGGFCGLGKKGQTLLIRVPDSLVEQDSAVSPLSVTNWDPLDDSLESGGDDENSSQNKNTNVPVEEPSKKSPFQVRRDGKRKRKARGIPIKKPQRNHSNSSHSILELPAAEPIPTESSSHSIPELPSAAAIPTEIQRTNNELSDARNADCVKKSTKTPKGNVFDTTRRRRSPRLASKEEKQEMKPEECETKQGGMQDIVSDIEVAIPRSEEQRKKSMEVEGAYLAPPMNASPLKYIEAPRTPSNLKQVALAKTIPGFDATEKKTLSESWTLNDCSGTKVSPRRKSLGNVGSFVIDVEVAEGPSLFAFTARNENRKSVGVKVNSPEDLLTPRRSARRVDRTSRFGDYETDKKSKETIKAQLSEAANEPSKKCPSAAAEKDNGRSVRRSGRNVSQTNRFGSYESESPPHDETSIVSANHQKKSRSRKEDGTSQKASESPPHDETSAVSANLQKQNRSRKEKDTLQKATEQTVSKRAGKSKKEENEKATVAQENIKENDHSWIDNDVVLLREAQKEVDPKSFSFWEDVSELVGTRSAVECREKWFSLVKTPNVRAPKSKKNPPPLNEVPMTPNDDDIFNATPMRALFSENNDDRDQGFGNLQFLSNLNLGSAVKVGRVPTEDHLPQMPSQRGYKTYLTNMKRNVHKTDKRRKPKIPTLPKPKSMKNFRERAGEGDVELNGRLSPGGTLHVKSNGNEDVEEDEGYLDMSFEDETDP
jgi:hypothetical protein